MSERERETVSHDHERVPGFMGKIAIKIKFADMLSAALSYHQNKGHKEETVEALLTLHRCSIKLLFKVIAKE